MDQNELITKITQEVMKRLQAEMSKQGVQLAGAASGKFTGADPASLAKYIDHTMLRPDAPLTAFDKLCDEAIQYGFKSRQGNGLVWPDDWCSACPRETDRKLTRPVLLSQRTHPIGISLQIRL